MKNSYAISAAVALLLAGCATHPLAIPEGTYRTSDGRAVLVFDRDRAALHVPTARQPQAKAPYGHEYGYQIFADGYLAFIGASTQYPYLRQLDCEWFWTGSAVECRRENGHNLTFVREIRPIATPPATDEQRVWLAVAQHLRNEGSAGATPGQVLVLRARTQFASRWGAVSQLRNDARGDFCGNSYDEARGILAGLKRMSHYDDKSLRDTFAHRPEFSLVDGKPGGGIGLSVVIFRGEDEAYVGMELGGREGAILRVSRRDGDWHGVRECARWTSS